MIAAILIIIAAICKATADTLQHHYYSSVFRNMNERWWNPEVSWKYVKFLPLTKYRADAWHISNSLMLCCLITAGGFYGQLTPFHWQLSWYWKVAGLGCLFVAVFNLFYNKILYKKTR